MGRSLDPPSSRVRVGSAPRDADAATRLDAESNDRRILRGRWSGKPKTGKIAVWALDPTHLDRSKYATFSPPRSQIGYLHAQAGLFTHHVQADRHFVVNGKKWPVAEKAIPTASLRKLTLPRSEVRELLHLLWMERISLAHLMPTHDNVTKTLVGIWSKMQATRNYPDE